LVRWRRDGTWERLLAHAQTKSDAVGELEWVVSVDASSVRAHQHAAGARTRPARAGSAAHAARSSGRRQGLPLSAVSAAAAPPWHRSHHPAAVRPARPPRWRPGRPLGFDRARYRGRSVVERCCNRRKQLRAVATRYDTRAVNYRAMVVIASLLIWLDR
jgi:transposase